MRIPIPLVFAVAVAVGAMVSILIQVNVYALGSWDSRYAAFNGTHIYQTGPMISTPNKTLYLGYGMAYFQNPVTVYYLQTVRSGSTGGAADLGRYLPIRVVVRSGSLPTNTYITWTDPYGGATRKLYFVAGSNRGYVLGTYVRPDGLKVGAGIPVYYVLEGSQVRLYPMEKDAVAVNEACSVVRNAGLDNAADKIIIFAVLDNWYVDCYYNQQGNFPVGWTTVASSVTSAALYPSPTYYKVTVDNVDIYLSYWYAVDRDPGFFIVRPG
jgi:hypothetical protein